MKPTNHHASARHLPESLGRAREFPDPRRCRGLPCCAASRRLNEEPPAFGSLPEDEPALSQTAEKLAATDDRCFFFGAFLARESSSASSGSPAIPLPMRNTVLISAGSMCCPLFVAVAVGGRSSARRSVGQRSRQASTESTSPSLPDKKRPSVFINRSASASMAPSRRPFRNPASSTTNT